MVIIRNYTRPGPVKAYTLNVHKPTILDMAYHNTYFQLKDRGADGDSSVTLEASLDNVKHTLTDSHLEGIIVPGTL